MPKRYFAIDLGATNMDAAIVDSDGQVLGAPLRCEARVSWSTEDLADCAAEMLKLLGTPQIDGLALGFPGLFDLNSGTILGRTVFTRMIGTTLSEVLSAHFSVAVRIDTDANLFTLGVQRFGQVQFSNFSCLSLGTNLGVGIVRRGSIDRGEHGMSSLSDSIFDRSGWWRLLSGARLHRLFDSSVADLAEAARGGDQAAKTCFSLIGSSLAHVICLLRDEWPEMEGVIIGGGLAKAADLFRKYLTKDLDTLKISIPVRTTDVNFLAGGAALFAVE